MIKIRPIFAIATIFLATGCGNNDGTEAETSPAWQVDPVPLLSIGGIASDTLALIGNAEGAAGLENGGVVVADRGYTQLRYFDSTGALAKTVGRDGDGPGEFRYIARMYRCGDTLHIDDIQRSEYLVFTLDGRFQRAYRPGAPEGAEFASPYNSTCGPSGIFLNDGWDKIRPDGEWRRAREDVPFWLSNSEGQPTVELGNFPGSERLVSPRGSGPHPLGKEAVIAMGLNRAYVGTADSFAIMVFGLDGQPVDTIVRPDVNLITTQVDRERFWLLDTLGKAENEKARNIDKWSNFEFPPTVPAYTAMIVDQQDNLWVRMFPRTADNVVHWVIFSSQGDQIGEIDLPVTLEVTEVGSDYVLGIEVQLADGSQAVRKYRLHRSQ